MRVETVEQPVPKKSAARSAATMACRRRWIIFDKCNMIQPACKIELFSRMHYLLLVDNEEIELPDEKAVEESLRAGKFHWRRGSNSAMWNPTGKPRPGSFL